MGPVHLIDQSSERFWVGSSSRMDFQFSMQGGMLLTVKKEESLVAVA